MVDLGCFPLARMLKEKNGDAIKWFSADQLKLILFSLIESALRDDKTIAIKGTRESIRFIFSKYSSADKSEQTINSEWETFKENYMIPVSLLEKILLFKDLEVELNQRIFYRENQIFGKQTLKEIFRLQIQAQEQFNKDYLEAHLNSDNYEFNQNEYWQIRGRIERAQELFKAEFRLLNKQNPFQDNIFINEEGSFSTSVLLKYLASFQSKAEILQQRYIEFFTDAKDNIYSDIQLQLKDGIKLCNKIIKFNSVFLPTKHLITELKELVSSISVYSLSEKNRDAIKEGNFDLEAIENISAGLNICFQKINSHFKSVLRSMNIRSNPSPVLLTLEDDLDKFIQSINESNIYKDRLENNSISSLKKYNNLKDIVDLLVSSTDQLIIMVDYYAWKAFVATMPMKIKAILSALESVDPSKWHHAFDSWYFHQVSQSFTKINSGNFLEVFQKYSDLVFEIETKSEEVFDLLINAFRAKKLISINSEKGLIDKFRNKVKELKFAEKPTKNSDSLRNFYPIKFVEDNYSEVEGEIAISFSDDNIESESFITIDNKSSQNDELDYIHHSRIDQSISSVNISQKLIYSRFLAKALALNPEHLQLFISKETNFIFDCSENVMEEFLSIQSLENLKKIPSGKDIGNQLTEFFLNDSSYGIYIYDHFKKINSNNDIYFHAQFIKSLENAGYSPIFIDVARLIEDEDYIYKQVELIPDHVW